MRTLSRSLSELAGSARRAVETYVQIFRNPQTFNQGSWRSASRCNTTFCFAGHVANNAGGKWLGGPESDVSSSLLYDPAVDTNPVEIEADYFGTPIKVEIVSASNRAKDLLGLSEYDAYSLFSGANSLDKIRSLITEYFGADPHDYLSGTELAERGYYS
jgi:hypothetical protein